MGQVKKKLIEFLTRNIVDDLKLSEAINDFLHKKTKVYFDESKNITGFVSWRVCSSIEHTSHTQIQTDDNEHNHNKPIIFFKLVVWAPSRGKDWIIKKIIHDFSSQYKLGYLSRTLSDEDESPIVLWPESNVVEYFKTLLFSGINEETIVPECTFLIQSVIWKKKYQFTISHQPENFGQQTPKIPKIYINCSISGLINYMLENTRTDFRSSFIRDIFTFCGDVEIGLSILQLGLRPTTTTIERFSNARKQSTGVNLSSTTKKIQLREIDDLKSQLLKHKPFVINNLADYWPVVDNSFSKFISTHGDTKIFIPSEHKNIKLKYFSIQLNSGFYSNQYTSGTLLPKELSDSFPPVIIDSKNLLSPQIWFGKTANKMTPATLLHRDYATGFLGQVFGRKRIRFYPPHEEDNLYPVKAYNNFQGCLTSSANENQKLFPKFEKAKGYDLILNPGEMLVTPVGWFHEVFSLDQITMSVSYFLKNEIIK